MSPKKVFVLCLVFDDRNTVTGWNFGRSTLTGGHSKVLLKTPQNSAKWIPPDKHSLTLAERLAALQWSQVEIQSKNFLCEIQSTYNRFYRELFHQLHSFYRKTEIQTFLHRKPDQWILFSHLLNRYFPLKYQTFLHKAIRFMHRLPSLFKKWIICWKTFKKSGFWKIYIKDCLKPRSLFRKEKQKLVTINRDVAVEN